MIAGAALSSIASACGGTGPLGPLTELDRQLDKWMRQRPASYRYTVERRCFCGPQARGPVEVTVSGDLVAARTYVDTGEPVPASLAELFPSVEGLFAVLLDAIERDAHLIDVTYDPVSGVPVDIWIDYALNVADEELGFTVVGRVTPTSPPRRAVQPPDPPQASKS